MGYCDNDNLKIMKGLSIFIFLFATLSCRYFDTKDVRDYYCTINPDSLNYGSYYKVGKYDIEVPFSNEPIKSLNNESDKIFNLNYRSLFVCRQDTIILGLGIYGFNDNSVKMDSFKFLSLMRLSQRALLSRQYNGLLINSDSSYFHNRYCFNDKYNLSLLYQGREHKQLYYSKIFSYKNLIVNLYAFTPMNDSCKIIVDGFYQKIRIN